MSSNKYHTNQRFRPVAACPSLNYYPLPRYIAMSKNKKSSKKKKKKKFKKKKVQKIFFSKKKNKYHTNQRFRPLAACPSLNYTHYQGILPSVKKKKFKKRKEKKVS